MGDRCEKYLKSQRAPFQLWKGHGDYCRYDKFVRCFITIDTKEAFESLMRRVRYCVGPVSLRCVLAHHGHSTIERWAHPAQSIVLSPATDDESYHLWSCLFRLQRSIFHRIVKLYYAKHKREGKRTCVREREREDAVHRFPVLFLFFFRERTRMCDVAIPSSFFFFGLAGRLD